MTRERELECVIADLKAEIKDRHEDYQLLGKDYHAIQKEVISLREQLAAALKTDQEPVMYWGDGKPLYLHPSRHLSDEEILDMWDRAWDTGHSADKVIVAFARKVLEKANG